MNLTVSMKNCPYCEAPGAFFFKISSRTYKRCSECDLIYKKSRDSYEKLLAHYRNDYFKRYSADQISGERGRLFGRILDLIEERKDTGKLLDVGTGYGVFLSTAQKRGWKVKGIEPSIHSVEVARSQYGLDIYNGTLKEYDENDEFEVITLINVIDHTAEPWEKVRKAKSLLKPNGVLFLRFPNGLFHSFILKVSKKLNTKRIITKFLVFHEYCLTSRFIKRLLSDYGFTEIAVYNASLSGESLTRFSSIFSFVARSIEVLEKVTDAISGGRVLWGPSLDVIARKK